MPVVRASRDGSCWAISACIAGCRTGSRTAIFERPERSTSMDQPNVARPQDPAPPTTRSELSVNVLIASRCLLMLAP